MGTRHLIAVQLDGQYKIAQYGQWDGYPEGQGATVLKFASDPENLKKLKANLSNVRFLDEEKDKTFLDEYNTNTPEWSSDPDNRTEEQKRWFTSYLTRNLGAKILNSIASSEDEKILLSNSINFAKNGSCDFAYVIDFDANTFEAFIMAGRTPTTGRFASNVADECGYYGVRLIKAYNLDNLPTKETFLKEMNELLGGDK